MKLTPETKIVIVGDEDIFEASLRAYFAGLGLKGVCSVGMFNPLDAPSTMAFFERERPEVVIIGSVRAGGIGVYQAQPAEFIHHNLLAQSHVIHAAYKTGVAKLLFLAAPFIYPKDCAQPMKEEYFLTGPVDPLNFAFAMSKAAGIAMCQAYRREHGFKAIVAVPATVYGPGMSMDIVEAHVLGALAGRFDRAVRQGLKSVELWGSGVPRREFIFSSDLASACTFLIENYDGDVIINIGAGEDTSVADLARIMAEASGYKGEVLWDKAKPDGAMRKMLDSSRLRAMGWIPQVSLQHGIAEVFKALRSSR